MIFRFDVSLFLWLSFFPFAVSSHFCFSGRRLHSPFGYSCSCFWSVSKCDSSLFIFRSVFRLFVCSIATDNPFMHRSYILPLVCILFLFSIPNRLSLLLFQVYLHFVWIEMPQMNTEHHMGFSIRLSCNFFIQHIFFVSLSMTTFGNVSFITILNHKTLGS